MEPKKSNSGSFLVTCLLIVMAITVWTYVTLLSKPNPKNDVYLPIMASTPTSFLSSDLPQAPSLTPTAFPNSDLGMGTSSTPTTVVQPTLEAYRTDVGLGLATALDGYGLTPLPTSANPPLPSDAVSLGWFTKNILQNLLASCSMKGYQNYFESWPTMVNVVNLVVGPNCLDGEGTSYHVQLPHEIVSRHVSDPRYPQIWITGHPYDVHGPAFDLQNGLYIQPFK